MANRALCNIATFLIVLHKNTLWTRSETHIQGWLMLLVPKCSLSHVPVFNWILLSSCGGWRLLSTCLVTDVEPDFVRCPNIQFKVGLLDRVIDISIISLSTLYQWKILYWHNDCLQTMMVMNVDAAVLAVSFPQCKNKKCLTSFLWSPLVLARVHSKVMPHWILINASCCFWDQ